jgi:hypothetical protein
MVLFLLRAISWCKATFCLRSGAVLEPPAVDPLPRFDVRVAEGRVFVRLPARQPEIRKLAADPRCFVIIGAGGAGAVAAQTLREAGFGGRVGEQYHPLPWDVLSYSPEHDGYLDDLDRDRLEGAPSYAAGETGQWDDPSYGRHITHYYARPLR